MNGIDQSENIRDIITKMGIENFHLVEGAAFGYLLGPNQLIEVDFWDHRVSQSLQKIPASVWEKKEITLPIEWLLFLKLRAWNSRSQRVPRDGMKNPSQNDIQDIKFILDKMFKAIQAWEISPDIISAGKEAVTKITKEFPELGPNLQTLGWKL
jgi:hypothetical protein